MYKNGFLPNANGWMQQSNKFIEVVEFIDLQLSNYRNELENKHGRQ